MRALSKLVQLNNPDLILFVGEALVGNDAVDQLKKFNQALIDMTGHVRRPKGAVEAFVTTSALVSAACLSSNKPHRLRRECGLIHFRDLTLEWLMEYYLQSSIQSTIK